MEYQGQIVVDSMENECNISYAAWPIRSCIITNGQIQCTGGMGPTLYKLNEVEDWLKRWKDGKSLTEPDGYDSHNQEAKRSPLSPCFKMESLSASKNNTNNDCSSNKSNCSRGYRKDGMSDRLVAYQCERMKMPRQP